MLILPEGHARRVATPRRLGRRERWMIRAVLVTVVALIVVVVLALASAGHSSANGCVDVNIPYSTGGQEFYECGARARAMCASIDVAGGYTGAAGDAVATQCRKAGIAVRR